MVRMRMTRSKTGNRRSHTGIVPPEITVQDGTSVRRHCVNPVTGMYRGRKIALPMVERGVDRRKKKVDMKERDERDGEVSDKKTVTETKTQKDVSVFDAPKNENSG